MQKLATILLSVFAFAHANAASAEDNIPWQKLYDSSKRYLEVCVSSGERSSMESTLQRRVKQRAADSEVGADQASYDIMLDWAASNQGKLKRKEHTTVAQACYYFVTFIDKGFAIPRQIRKSFTPANSKEMLEHLDGEVKKKSP